VSANDHAAGAIGEDGELFSWGLGYKGTLGHGDMQDQPAPKRVEALQGVRVSSVSPGHSHALALAEDGLVYAWGENKSKAVLGNSKAERERRPKPVEALRGVRVSIVAAGLWRSFAVADTGELWEWGLQNSDGLLQRGELMNRRVPKRIKSLQGVKMDAVAAGESHTLVLADDGSVYVWGDERAAASGAFGLGPEADDDGWVVMPQRIPALRVACGL
jgi:alpha-tubulin suppressor-like RCC1 family protein